MHYGDLVSVNKESIKFSKNLFTPISIHNGSTIYGLYYPSNKSLATEEYKDYLIEHDIMFTPIPPHLWPYLGRFNILIRHKKGSLGTITRYLKKQEINILTSECNRSGHRYMSWTFTVAFEKLWVDSLDPAKNRVFTEEDDKRLIELEKKVDSAIKKLTKKIQRQCASVLLDKDNCHFEDNVEGYPVKSLLYFYRYYKKNDNELEKPFKASVESDAIKFHEKGVKIIEHCNIDQDLPTYGFVEMNTRDINIRVAILPKKLLKDFRSLYVKYRRTNSGSSRGILSDIITPLTDHCNLWRVSHNTYDNTTTTEEGSIHFILQHMATDSGTIVSWETIEDKFALVKENLPTGIKLVEEVFNPIRRIPIFISCKLKLDLQKDIYDDCKYVGEQLGILENDFILSIRDKGPGITHSVVEDLKNCQGMIQFFVANKKKDQLDWISAEALAAISQNIPFVRIVDKTIEDRIIVAKEKKSFVWHLDRKKRRKEIRAALKELIQNIDGES